MAQPLFFLCTLATISFLSFLLLLLFPSVLSVSLFQSLAEFLLLPLFIILVTATLSGWFTPSNLFS